LTADEATDRLYALLSHDVYWLLVQRRGWRPARWRRDVGEQALHQVLPPPAGGS
jgi:hypothetical protein